MRSLVRKSYSHKKAPAIVGEKRRRGQDEPDEMVRLREREEESAPGNMPSVPLLPDPSMREGGHKVFQEPSALGEQDGVIEEGTYRLTRSLAR